MAQSIGVKIAGVFFNLVLASIWAALALWLWPDGVGDVPLSHLTLSLVAKAGGAVVLWVMTIGSVWRALMDAFD